MFKLTRDEQGQSALIVALAMIGIIAFLALVVDAGSVYAQRRQTQNAVDAASYAGADRLAAPDPTSHSRATNGQVMSAVTNYAQRNGLDPTKLQAHYVTRDHDNNPVVDPNPLEYWGGANAQAPAVIGGRPVDGVQVVATKQFNSFFAGVVGINSFSVAGNSFAYCAPPLVSAPAVATPPINSNGTCCGQVVFPIALNIDTFTDENGDGLKDVHFEESDPGFAGYQLWDKSGLTGPGNYGYVHWSGQGTDSATLGQNMTDALNDVNTSGIQYVNDWIPSATSSFTSVEAKLRSAIGHSVIIPIYSHTSGTLPNLKYQITAFARMDVKGVCRYGSTAGSCPVALGSTSYPYIQAKFQQWVFSLCEGACPNFGITSCKPRQPMNPERSLQGVVKLNKLIPAGRAPRSVPVDVVHVLDISGSMSYSFGSPSQVKLSAAKNALTTFDNLLLPLQGDKAGLTTFPRVTSGTNYSYSCQQSGSWGSYLWGNPLKQLTSNITSLNSTINGLSASNGTPLAGGLFQGRQMVLNPSYHVAGHLPVMILASDGIANVRLNGTWTGFQGTSYSAPQCNSLAVQDAIDQANIAKSDADDDGKPDILIFSIAIGTDFNPVSLEAIASEPKSTHFYSVASGSTMQSIYTQISTRLDDGDCLTTQQETFAPYAVVNVRNQDTGATLQTTTTSTGFFSFTNLDPGTYEFTSVSVVVGGMTYDIFTDGVGGPLLDSNPTVEVGTGQGSYEKNVFLKTDDLTCP